MSTHATDEHFQAAPRDLCFKTSLCFKRYSPTHVLKLFLEHFEMKLLGYVLMSRAFPKPTPNKDGLLLFLPFLPF